MAAFLHYNSAAQTDSGTFTALSTNLAAIEDSAIGGATHDVAIHPNDLDTIPDEIQQVVHMFQKGWGAQLGAGQRLGLWATVALLEKFLQAYKQRGAPRAANF